MAVHSTVRVISNATNWRVEEDTAWEVSVAPLSEWGLLPEVLLHSGEVLHLELVVTDLVSGAEMLIVHRLTRLLLRDALLVWLAHTNRFSSPVTSRVAHVNRREAHRAACIFLCLLLCLDSQRLVSVQLFLLITVVVIDKGPNLTGVAPLVDVLVCLTLHDIVYLRII